MHEYMVVYHLAAGFANRKQGSRLNTNENRGFAEG